MKYIYGLIDPRDRKIKYVGQSNDPIRRYDEHVDREEATKKGLWVQELRALNMTPEQVLLGECEDKDVFQLENCWIVLARRLQWPITNGTKQGDWRLQGDFLQFFSEELHEIEAQHLKKIEELKDGHTKELEDHKKELDNLKENHRLACEAMELESIVLAKKYERMHWIYAIYLFGYVITTCTTLFNAYQIITGGVTIDFIPFWDRFLAGMVCLAPLAYLVVHYIWHSASEYKFSFRVELVFWLEVVCSIVAAVANIYTLGQKSS